MSRIVVKFGGTSIVNGERIRLGAKAVYREYKKGTEVAVVVSAMGHATDELIKAAKESTDGRVDARELDDIMAMGEQTSARVFAAALRSLGADAKYIDPKQRGWPVVTDSNFGSANVNLAETRMRVQKFILPLLKKRVIPVMCGFLGKDKHGNITTIGRGGSDITGFLTGECLDANGVIIVTDAEGVMTADPNKIKKAQLIKRISVEEMFDLARFGAQVMHPRAMSYKNPHINAKVIHFRYGNLSARGTTIVGPKEAEFVGVRAYEKPLAMLTIVGEEMQTTPGILVKSATPLTRAGINIFGISIGPRSFSIYVMEKDSSRALELLHKSIILNRKMKSVTSENNIALLIAESERFIYTPGAITKLSEPLARARINVIEIFSSRASISFFVNWDDRKKALKLLRQSMKEVK
ncbi:MAG: aspartate kinase [Candidatus Hadarchaeaceae archaeon]|nr:aspartate kinase [Hadesarchaea archaeon]MDH5684988.1 aspartate kinase [Hadesarchaea archaeon]